MTYCPDARQSSASPQTGTGAQARSQSEEAASFADHRASTATAKQLQAMMDASPRHDGLGALMQMVAQRAAGRTALAQPAEDTEPELAMSSGSPVAQSAREEVPIAENAGLPHQLKLGIERLSGMSMGHVRVHYNSSQPAQLNAHAYAQGSDIHIAAGQEKHLPHEAWHVVQQAQGRVKPTLQMKGNVPVNDDADLEREADVMGGQAFAAGKNMAETRQREGYSDARTTPGSFSISPETPAQPKLILNGRTIEKKTLFDGSAFKKRLTKQMDVHAKRFNLSRDEVRYNIIELIESDQTHSFASTTELMETASGNVHVDEEMDGHVNDENWLVFGMDGKTKIQVQHAIRIGYRNFDCAQSYGTTAMLGQLIEDSGIDRSEFKITYKFDLINDEPKAALKARIIEQANLFDGYFDYLLIHNLDAGDATASTAWVVLNELKAENIANSVGLGNLNEDDAHLVGELKKAGKIDVVENSLSSVFSSPDLMDMIKGTGADLMYYDVVSTAAEIGICSPDGIKAIMSAVENQMEGDTRRGEKRTHMIMSSGNLGRNIGNFKDFGDGADRENDWLNDEKNTHINTIDRWQKEQTTVQNDDADFALSGGVKDELSRIVDDNAAGMRGTIATAAGGAAKVTAQHVRDWLNANTALTNHVQDNVRVPARPGLKKRYFDMTLGKVLEALFCPKNCDWKWSIQLVQLMIAENGLWDSYLKAVSDQIVAK